MSREVESGISEARRWNETCVGIGGEGRARVYRQGVAAKFNSTASVWSSGKIPENSIAEFALRGGLGWMGGGVVSCEPGRHAAPETDTENVFRPTTSIQPIEKVFQACIFHATAAAPP